MNEHQEQARQSIKNIATAWNRKIEEQKIRQSINKNSIRIL